MKIILLVNGTSLPATLEDNATARDFLSMLPLDLSIEDYIGKEKIGYLPRKLVTTGAGPFSGEAPGDICYYAPWGNLAIFYGFYRYSSGLIRLGRLEASVRPLVIDQPFSLRIEAAAQD